jgi:cytochrome c oxidase assembly protein subunit 15
VTPEVSAGLRRWGHASAALVFVQSVLGGLVRHTDAGLACPDIPLCLGRVVPPLQSGLVTLHFFHRALGVAAALAVVGLATWAVRKGAPPSVRGWTGWAAALAVIQVGLGFLSVYTRLDVVPVALHTLVAASLIVTLVHLTAVGRTAQASAPVA